MQEAFRRYAVDLVLASKPLIMQRPVVLVIQEGRAADPIESLVVLRFNRLGNNIYQMLHAIMIAHRLRIRSLVACDFPILQSMPHDASLDLSLSVVTSHLVAANTVMGNFFAPFGFETLLGSYGVAETRALVERCAPIIYSRLVEPAAHPRPRTVALHFRGGDIFSPYGHDWYVQPPAAFYLMALEHALRRGAFERIDLVYEDRRNPAIAVVEQRLQARGIPFRSGSGTVETDMVRLLEADSLIASYGTFCEAAALISPNLKTFYGFRSFSCQGSLVPFLQARFQFIVESRGVAFTMIEDLKQDYTAPRSWKNTEAQRVAIVDYPVEGLRLYDATLPR